MPSEVRRVVFTRDELLESLREQRGDTQGMLPPGQLTGVRFADDSHNLLTLSIIEPDREKAAEAVLSAASVAAALIRYCMRLRIPLPRDAQKSIALSGDNIVLDLRTPPKRS